MHRFIFSVYEKTKKIARIKNNTFYFYKCRHFKCTINYLTIGKLNKIVNSAIHVVKTAKIKSTQRIL